MIHLERILLIAERVINLVRPKFYNRLTWVVVLAGLVLMSSPWWTDLVNALASRYFSVTLPPSESHFDWGLALVLVGLTYHTLVHYVSELISERRTAADLAAQRQHDRGNFQAFVALLSEEDLGWILQDLLGQHAYVSAQGRTLDDAVRHLLAPSTQFIDPKIVEVAQAFGISLKDLRNWISLNFFAYGLTLEDGSHRFCLYPNLNQDRASNFPTPEESRRYNEFSNQLHERVDDAEKKYGAFRDTVKKTLAV